MVARFLDPNAPDPLRVYVLTFQNGDYGTDHEVFADYDRAVDAVVQSIDPDNFDEEDGPAILALKDIADPVARYNAALDICNSDKRAEHGYRWWIDECEVIGLAERPTQELSYWISRDQPAIAKLLYEFVGFLNGKGYDIIDKEAPSAPPGVYELAGLFLNNFDVLKDLEATFESGRQRGQRERV